jgi:hypothetical protein
MASNKTCIPSLSHQSLLQQVAASFAGCYLLCNCSSNCSSGFGIWSVFCSLASAASWVARDNFMTTKMFREQFPFRPFLLLGSMMRWRPATQQP